jgi:hypothetical protein
MADAVLPLERLFGQRVLKVGEFSGAPTDVELTVSHHGNTCGVVPAIFEPFKALHDDGHKRFRTDVSDNAAHK